MAKSSLNSLVDTVGDWYAKLPNLPKGGRDAIVTITPWIALIFGVLGILGGIAGLGILTVFSPLAALGGMSGVSSVGTGMISAILWLVSSVLLLMAFPGTRKHKESGWMFLIYSETVSLIGNVIAVSVSGVVVSLIAFYLIYQIRSYYK